MGHKVGWITLCAGIAGGADVILIPEMPYNLEHVMKAIEDRNRQGKNFSIIAIAEGALTKEEEKKKKKERACLIAPGNRLAEILSRRLAQDVRAIVPGHLQRGGDPTSTDRLLCSRFGAMAGELVKKGQFGYMVALRGTEIVAVPLCEVAGKLKSIPPDSQLLRHAELLGISMGV